MVSAPHTPQPVRPVRLRPFLQQRHQPFLRYGQRDLERITILLQFRRTDFIGMSDERFGEREATTKVGEITRRGQHHYMRDGVEGERDG